MYIHCAGRKDQRKKQIHFKEENVSVMDTDERKIRISLQIALLRLYAILKAALLKFLSATNSVVT